MCSWNYVITDVTWASAFLNQNFAKSQSSLVSLAVQTLKVPPIQFSNESSPSLFNVLESLPQDFALIVWLSHSGHPRAERWYLFVFMRNCQETEGQQSGEILGWNYCQWKVYLWWWLRRVPHGKTKPLAQPLKGVHLFKIKQLVVKRKNHLPLSFLPPSHPVETPKI